MTHGELLEEMFRKFPGIGSRQAKRFVYFLLNQPVAFNKELSENIFRLKDNMEQCSSCFRFFERKNGGKECSICAGKRDDSILMILEKDVDLETVERSGGYKGRYFVLGGILPILEKNPTSKIRIKELIKNIENSNKKLKEIILALSLNAEGENTIQYVKKTIEPISEKLGLKITSLGRGFSTGLELEYSDEDTLKNALKNRG